MTGLVQSKTRLHTLCENIDPITHIGGTLVVDLPNDTDVGKC